MRIIVLDDEALQLETILEYVSELYPDADLKGFSRVSELQRFMEIYPIDVAILDISVPGTINGIQLGQMLREKNRRVKLLYCTGYSDYAIDAYRIHANGYLSKPVRKEDLKKELQYILEMPVFGGSEKPYIHTFGNFDVFAGSIPVVFKRSKSKEVLAYLVDREGSWVTNRELMVMLWDECGPSIAFSKYVTTLVNEMMVDLESAGVSFIVERRRGKLRLLRNEVVCDYFDFLDGEPQAKSRFHQEYMSQYSWGETTLASLTQSDS